MGSRSPCDEALVSNAYRCPAVVERPITPSSIAHRHAPGIPIDAGAVHAQYRVESAKPVDRNALPGVEVDILIDTEQGLRRIPTPGCSVQPLSCLSQVALARGTVVGSPPRGRAPSRRDCQQSDWIRTRLGPPRELSATAHAGQAASAVRSAPSPDPRWSPRLGSSPLGLPRAAGIGVPDPRPRRAIHRPP
jgi:hypothetical protein